MTALTADTVVMPIWVFVLNFIGGTAFITYLMWANTTQREDNQRLRRRLHNQGVTFLEHVVRGERR